MDELIKRLRDAAQYIPCIIYREDGIKSADAIESVSKAYQMMAEAYEREVTKQKWIPVTERLPDILHTVIISGRMKYEWEKDYTQFVDVATYTEGEFFETFNDWYEGQHEFEITHWMPLPEPPKGE